MCRVRGWIRAACVCAAVGASLLPLRAFEEPRNDAPDPNVGAEGGVGPYARFVLSLAVDPAAPATLYAGTNGGGVFKSADGAKTWSMASGSAFKNRSYRQGSTIGAGSLGSPIVLALAVDPSQVGTLYAGTSEGLFKSTDGGTSWTKTSAGMRSTFVLALAMDPASPALYAGTATGVVKSSNRGESWTSMTTGLANTFVTALAIDPTTPSRIYAGTDAEIFVSADGAESWKRLTMGGLSSGPSVIARENGP